MVYLRSVIDGSKLTAISESDSKIVLSGMVNTITFNSSFSELEFNPHKSSEVELIIIGEKLMVISYGEKKDVIGNIKSFIICEKDWCEEFTLTLGIFYSNSGKRDKVMNGEVGEKSPIWSDYYMGIKP